MILALITFIFLQIADAYLTLRILGKGGKELNKPMRWIMERIGAIPGLAVAKGAYIAVAIGCAFIVPVWVMWLVSAAYAILVGWNLWVFVHQAPLLR